MPINEQTTMLDPLTRRNSAGELLQREGHVEAQIALALPLSDSRLLQRACIADKEDPAFLQEEALVHLIRRFRRENKLDKVEQLTDVLLARCTAYLGSQVYRLGAEEAKDCYQEIVAALLDRLWDLDSDRGDYLEVRFWLFLRRLASDSLKRFYAEQKQSTANVMLDGQVEADGDEEQGVSYKLATPGLGPEDKLLLRDALAALPEPIRTVFVLRHYEGWPVEDRDPSVPTISSYFGKTSRTIRNWLAESEKILAAWRGEKQKA